jgi:leader peptidase (prepilin peptidase) / N-methyltransferase
MVEGLFTESFHSIESVSPWALSLVAFVFGSILGSFLNVCIVRLPNKESIVNPSSHCPNCKAGIAFYDNIPLVSYLFLRGRCRLCKERISPRYFFVELLTGVLTVALLFRFGPSLGFLVSLIFIAALIVISFIDLDVRIVPDVISLPGIGLGLLASFLQYPWPIDPLSIPPSPFDSLIGILAGGGFLLLVAWLYECFTGIEGMGGGDVKLLAMIGAFLGWPSIPLTLFFASITGSVIGVFLMVRAGAGGKYALPFAPFLCLGAVLYLFFGMQVVQFYLPGR